MLTCLWVSLSLIISDARTTNELQKKPQNKTKNPKQENNGFMKRKVTSADQSGDDHV